MSAVGAGRRFERWADRWLLLLACGLFLAISPVALPLALSAGRNEGTPGTFTADEKDCDRYSCGWRGSFVSDDGRIRIEDTTLDSPDLERPGDRARAQKIAGDEGLYEPADNFWLVIVAGDVGSAAYVAWWVWARRRQGKRNQECAGAAQTE